MRKDELSLQDKLLAAVFAAWLVTAFIPLFVGNRVIFLIDFISFAVVFALAFVIRIYLRNENIRMLKKISHRLSPTERDALEQFPMPCIAVDAGMGMHWYNRPAAEMLRLSDGTVGYIDACSSGISLRWNSDSCLQNATVCGKGYSVYGRRFTSDGKEMFMLCFHNDDLLKRINKEYRLTRPSVMFIQIDNYDELLRDIRDLDRSQLVASVEGTILGWTKTSTGVVNRYSRDKYMMIIEQRDIDKYIDEKFSILEAVKKLVCGDNVTPTISIGIGHGCRTLGESEVWAGEALDMALGRGGDQVVIKSDKDFQFFGGTSKGIERNSRVRSRIVASSLETMIKDAGNVVIMGHRQSDLDCVGASVGLQFASIGLGKDAKCVVNRDITMAADMIDAVAAAGYNIFVSPAQAKKLVDSHTLLIIVDSNRKEIIEAPELIEAAGKVVVIDHHRKTADHIQGTALMFHEPNASSACEMVTELIQYMNCGNPGKLQSEALIAGIMLDTKNFTNQTGVRTFEAAAFLKRRGADTQSVRRMFANTVDDYRKKAQLISNIISYKGVAIAVWTGKYDESLRLVAAQAADELLSVKGVIASFTMFQSPEAIVLSARSMGGLNVQLVTEQLGGGGHHTMAGAQMKGISTENALLALKAAIDKVLSENSANE